MPIVLVSHDQPVSINKDADFIFVTKDIESDYRKAKSKDEDKMYGSWWSKYCITVPAIGFDRLNKHWHYSISSRQWKTTVDIIGKYMELTLIKTKRYEGDLVELNFRINT